MDLHINKKSVIIFDLDDTLYQEVDYLKSAYKEIVDPYVSSRIMYMQMMSWFREGKDVFQNLYENYDLRKNKLQLIEQYRKHFPNIKLNSGAKLFIEELYNYSIVMGLITDGRSLSQRHKIKALGLNDWINEIVISEELGSEKPNFKNYRTISQKYIGSNFIYIGDNPQKDFITPNSMGWYTIGIKDKGDNIHSQDIPLDITFQPHVWLSCFEEIKLIYS
ncbi:HAD family hydrolase [Ancylomarina sp. 16SWW S1-10-2]|uniref:HAD family hydrolase n=1 Tax=Ancylomarina sp. 16SWW S1-10-2 TaxID=2499681 RepID=UPI0012AE764C|nr:HAD family hydrolase [Ancylomarina sp. 16SWW S1-10-2]MRT93417.1 HAD family hydrolase [Ancylomarina sp. 16SWW S1-10-2]